MTILVTGAGLVGSHAAAQLAEMGEQVVLFDVAPSWENLRRVAGLESVEVVRGDILDFPDLLRVIKEKGVRRIIHTAAFLTAGARARPYAAIKVNILGTANILEAARNLDIERVVFTSSVTVYYGAYARPDPAHGAGPQGEDFNFRAISQRPQGVYATTKLASEHLGLCYRDSFGVDFVAVRFAGVFGPWLGPVAGLPGMALKELAERPLRDKNVKIGRDLVWLGKEEFLYMKDAAQSTVKACLAPKRLGGEAVPIYNVSMGRGYEFEDVLETLQDVYPGVAFEVEEEGEARAGGYADIPKNPVDLSRTRNDIGYQPRYLMQEALMDYRNWMEKWAT
ncbi:MAG: NAD(P)-dependent oxidoreductase [Dehalococcoidia bacterium]|nr:NAD(P)-dependent oxidoreductase [Dehalococcoidia bacterium]